jgi:hypothetical protein
MTRRRRRGKRERRRKRRRRKMTTRSSRRPEKKKKVENFIRHILYIYIYIAERVRVNGTFSPFVLRNI